jgi:quercetin dioxygenase-like cupin family protein
MTVRPVRDATEPHTTPTIAVTWGSGSPISGTPFRELVASAETDGRVVILGVDMPAGEVVDEHTHTDEDQIVVVIDGEVLATRGGEAIRMGPGSVAFFPRGVPHSLRNGGSEPARVLDCYTPGGFEQVFVDAGSKALAADGPEPR